MPMKKMFLLHHAGGDKYAYRALQQELSLHYEAIALEIPGRGDRYAEPLLYDMDSVVDDLYAQIKPMLTDNYAFVGVSMGALKAFLLTHRIFEDKCPLPQHLFLASRKSILGYRSHIAIAHLNTSDFWNGVAQYGGVSEKMLAHPELLELYEPILRADFQALEKFSNYDFPPLPMPASILIGKEDTIAIEDTLPWQHSFISPIETQVFSGGHFFVYEQILEIAAYIGARF